jgi:hypothetical protein
MSPFSLRARKLGVFFLICWLLTVSTAWTKPTSPAQARLVVSNWLSLTTPHLGAALGNRVQEVQTFADDTGAAAYYIVYLAPAGLVIVPADDLLEPIIGYVSQGTYNASDDNPLGFLVRRDLAGRLALARGLEPGARSPEAKAATEAQRKWDRLLQPEAKAVLAPGVPSVADERVSPLVQTGWGQKLDKDDAGYCYNYFTPYHYPCGCIATAMAQVMKYHQHPTTGVTAKTFWIWLGPEDAKFSHPAVLKGGDEAGGPYNWSQMPLDPGAAASETERRAIGALTHDAGASVYMWYQDWGSGADESSIYDALVNTFQYSSARRTGYLDLKNPLNASLDAAYPVLLSLTASGVGGHEVIADGYGYDLGAMYHHLNMGWCGDYDAWYNLPDFWAKYQFHLNLALTTNIFPTGTGEIISGRVTTLSGHPISNVKIVASPIGKGHIFTYQTTTNSRGIYALAQLPSDSDPGRTYTVKASKAGYAFFQKTVTLSTNQPPNRWGVDFKPAAMISHTGPLLLQVK